MKINIKSLTSLMLLAFTLTLLIHGDGLILPTFVLQKLPQMVTVFLSIIIQALPFVLIGVFGSALIHNLVSVELVESVFNHTRKLPGIFTAIGMGFFFPVCDCGVFPVVRRFLYKKVPPYMAVAFLITAPLINPITIWATAVAFGYSLPITLLRVGTAICVGVLVALATSRFFPRAEDLLTDRAIQEMETTAVGAAPDHALINRDVADQIITDARSLDAVLTPPTTAIETAATDVSQHQEPALSTSFFFGIVTHAAQELLEVAKYLIIGSLVAAGVQTYVPRETLLVITANPVLSVLVMMLLALTLSLCAEADAFVARSFTFHFPLGSVMAFMIFGQMIDLKNAFLILRCFKFRAFLFIFGLCAVLVFIFGCILNLFPLFNQMTLRRF